MTWSESCVWPPSPLGSARHTGTNWDVPPPTSFLCREVNEYDRRSDTGSSSGARTRASLPSPKREEEEHLSLDPAATGVRPDDFVDDASLALITNMILARSMRGEEEYTKRRRRDDEISDILLQKGVAAPVSQFCILA